MLAHAADALTLTRALLAVALTSAVAAALFIVELRRLFTVTIPTFLTDLASLARPRD